MVTFKTSLSTKIEGQEAWEGQAKIPIFQTTEDEKVISKDYSLINNMNLLAKKY